MNRNDERRVFVLDRASGAPNGVLHELTVAQANAQAGLAAERHAVPVLSAALRARGAAAVLVLQRAGAGAGAVKAPGHWLDAEHARGWITPVAGHDIDSLLPAWQSMLALGHVPADAALLAWPALPWLSWGEQPVAALAAGAPAASASAATAPAAGKPPATTPPANASVATAPPATPPLGLYAIADSAPSLRRMLEAGLRTVQVRIKRPPDADAAWDTALRDALRDSLHAASDHGALLFVNDHWRLAAELGARAVHLGQEDLIALGDSGRADLQASGLALGVSSHAVWELCRARSLAPRYLACGPVWPTTTKDMPWRPQGLDNLAWWCRVAGVPVVAIGGILAPEQVKLAAASGADGVCVLRGLGGDPRLTVPALQQAFDEGRQQALDQACAQAGGPVPLLHPTLGAAA